MQKVKQSLGNYWPRVNYRVIVQGESGKCNFLKILKKKNLKGFKINLYN